MKKLRLASDALLVLAVLLLGAMLVTDAGWIVILAVAALAGSIALTVAKRQIAKQRRRQT